MAPNDPLGRDSASAGTEEIPFMSDDDIPLRRPSDDPVELGSQLLRELDGIHREGGSWKEPSLFRAYLQHAQALAWQGIARGDLNAPRHVLDQLLSAQSFVDRHRAEPPDLAARAAEDVHQVIRSLYLADEVLQEARTRVRLADRDRSRTEREILRVLFENRGTYLRRGAVRSRMKTADRVTPARVGQILVDLHDEGIVLRDHGRAQGSPSAAHYALSPQGIEICRELGLPDVGRIRRLIERIFAPGLEDLERKMLLAALSSCSDPKAGDLVIETLEEGIRQGNDAATAERYKEVLVAVLLARRQIDFAARVTDRPSAAPAPAAAPGRGLHVLKSKKEAEGIRLDESIVNAYIGQLENTLAKDGLIKVLREERGRLAERGGTIVDG
jgi:hypothetical protein